MLGPVFRLGSTSSGGGGTVTSPGMHPYRLPMADNTQDIIDSKLQADTAAGLNMFMAGRSFNVGLGPADDSAVLEADSTAGGVLVPRMTAAQMNAIVLPATGLLIYQTGATQGFYYYDGAAWVKGEHFYKQRYHVRT